MDDTQRLLPGEAPALAGSATLSPSRPAATALLILAGYITRQLWAYLSNERGEVADPAVRRGREVGSPAMPDRPTIDDCMAAAGAIAGRVHRTPTFTSHSLGGQIGRDVVLKAELFQRTGSFKLR
ncbi:MAG: hypothetical protein ACRDLP_17490, partial [Solirubrobacteraceae bacterium]